MRVQLGAAPVDRHGFSNRDYPTQNRTDGRPARAVATRSAGSKKKKKKNTIGWMNVRGFVQRIGVNNPNRIKLVLTGFTLHDVEGDSSVPVSCGSVLKRTKSKQCECKM